MTTVPPWGSGQSWPPAGPSSGFPPSGTYPSGPFPSAPHPSTPYPTSGPIGPKRPGAAGYWIGSISMLLGVVAIIVVAAVGISRAARVLEFPRMLDPSGGVQIDEPGGYVIFAIGSESAVSQSATGMFATVTDPDGAVVHTAAYEGWRTTSRIDPATGVSMVATAIATFRADKAGTYHLGVSNPSAGMMLGVGRGVESGIGPLILGGLVGGILALGGLIVVIVTAVRRSRGSHGAGPPTGMPGGSMVAGRPVVVPSPGVPGSGPVPGTPNPWTGYPGGATGPPSTPFGRRGVTGFGATGAGG